MTPSTADMSLSVSHDSHEMLWMRFHNATYGAAIRIREQLSSGLEQLVYQSHRPKSGQWLNQTAFLVDALRNDALNGTDISLILDKNSAPEVKKEQLNIATASTAARDALFSAASPLQCAQNFSYQVEPFAGLCRNVMAKLDAIITERAQEGFTEKNHYSARAKPADSQKQATGMP